MIHPLLRKFRKCKSLDQMLAVVDRTKDEVNEEFLEIILRDTRNYFNLGKISFAFDLAELSFHCASILNSEYYQVSSRISKANLFSLTNDFERAFELCDDIRSKHALEEEQEAELFLVKGNAHSLLRDYEKALLAYKRAMDIYDRISNKSKSELAKLNIARVYLETGKLNEAERNFRECEDFFQSKSAGGAMSLAQAVDGTGRVEANRHNYQKSIDLLDEAFDLYLEAGSPMRAYYTRLFLIRIYMELNDFAKAHNECSKAREHLSKFSLHLDVARVDWHEGLVFSKEGEYDQALLLLKNAKKTFTKFGAEPEVARILVNEAIVLYKKGDFEETLNSYSESRKVFLKKNMEIDGAIVDLNEANIRRHLGQENEAKKLLIRCLQCAVKKKVALLIYACKALLGNIYQKENQLSEAAGFYEDAIEVVEKIRTDIRTEWLKMRFVLDKQRVYEQLALTYVGLGLPTLSLQVVERSKLQSLLDMMLKSPKIETTEIEAVESIQSLLDEKTVIVEYFVTPKACLMFVINRTMFHFKLVPIQEEDLRQMVKGLLDEIGDPGTIDNKFSCRLYEILIKSTTESVDKASRICFIPHKFLYNIPFCALKDGKFLIEEHQIFYTPSLILLYSLLKKGTMDRNSILLMANPQGDLPKSEVEGREISQFFTKRELLFGDAATRNKLFTQASEYDIVHIACHGLFKEEKPQESALILADGPLKAIEISSSNLDFSLVNLSACMSGKVRIGAGDELVGLLRGFLRSGTHSVVASLWEVWENSSVDFMRKFYKNIQTLSISESFHLAQVDLMTKYPDPIVWASYILVGDPR